jgi:hypothetical protein
MSALIPFRVHFQADGVPPCDTWQTDAGAARKRAEEARPDELIRKIKVIREKTDD